MELTNTFTVATPIDEMWPILCDIERIAPCMPGAQLTEVEGDEYRGVVKIKVGPINATFKGTATMTSRDDETHRAVLHATGKDTGGKGNARATITASAEAADGGGTEVTITTDLSITGKVAQFGRSAMADISTKLLDQFVDCLESRVLSGASSSDVDGAAADGGGVGAAAGGSAGADEEPVVHGPEAEPIDLLDAAGAPVAKRLAFPVAAVMAVFFALYWRRRRSR